MIMTRKSRTFRSWESMKQRCLNPKSANFRYYGAAGIVVCEKWMKYAGFFEDMGSRPLATSLGRIDNNKGYYKENCRWETSAQQAHNKGPYKKNKGLTGVTWYPDRQDWVVRGDQRYLGRSKSLFEACCIRKSWENACKISR